VESSDRRQADGPNNGETEADALQKVERDRIPQLDGSNDTSSKGKEKQVGGASAKTLKLFSKTR